MRIHFPPREQIADRKSAFFNRFRFVGETIAELKKVTWPSREETKRLSTMVVIVSVAMGILLGLVDEGFSTIANALFF